MSRNAVIDLGTNTFNLLIADSNSNPFKELFSTKNPVKLGEGGIGKGLIAEAAFKRGISALMEFKKIIDFLKAEKVIAFATSAIRSASNGNDFILTAFKETGIEIKMISGEQEAEYIYFGIRAAAKMNEKFSLIMDIGGGSTEFIIADKDKIAWKHSFLLGAARLLERFQPSDPITQREIESIENYFEKELEVLVNAVQQYPVQELIGSSGAFDSFADIILCSSGVSGLRNKGNEFAFRMEDYYTIHNKIMRSAKPERLRMKGLVEMRVDMIVISTIFVNYILKRLGIRNMRVSRYSLKEGVLMKHFHV